MPRSENRNVSEDVLCAIKLLLVQQNSNRDIWVSPLQMKEILCENKLKESRISEQTQKGFSTEASAVPVASSMSPSQRTLGSYYSLNPESNWAFDTVTENGFVLGSRCRNFPSRKAPQPYYVMEARADRQLNQDHGAKRGWSFTEEQSQQHCRVCKSSGHAESTPRLRLGAVGCITLLWDESQGDPSYALL